MPFIVVFFKGIFHEKETVFNERITYGGDSRHKLLRELIHATYITVAGTNFNDQTVYNALQRKPYVRAYTALLVKYFHLINIKSAVLIRRRPDFVGTTLYVAFAP